MYFTDENALGLGKLLRRSGREDVVYPGHEGLPEIPRGTDDLVWLPIVGTRGLIVLSRERRIRTRLPNCVRTTSMASVRSGSELNSDLGPKQQLEIFLRHEERLKREIIKRGPGPWAVAISPSGVRPLILRPNPGLRLEEH
ncbi:MAG: hypothetical protein QM650_09695 [Microlunatus sp.]